MSNTCNRLVLGALAVGLNPGDDAHPLLGTTDKRYNAERVKRLARKNPDRTAKMPIPTTSS